MILPAVNKHYCQTPTVVDSAMLKHDPWDILLRFPILTDSKNIVSDLMLYNVVLRQTADQIPRIKTIIVFCTQLERLHVNGLFISVGRVLALKARGSGFEPSALDACFSLHVP